MMRNYQNVPELFCGESGFIGGGGIDRDGFDGGCDGGYHVSLKKRDVSYLTMHFLL